MILAIKNAIPNSPPDAQPDDVAGRIVRRTLAKREDQYASEVRRLLDAALEVIRRCGTSSRPRVADIVVEAGLSNDAFYRHFRSKDALVTAILEDGGERLQSYLAHQMAKESTPEGQVRRWVPGVLAQADKDIAATTLAVLWNARALVGDRRRVATSPARPCPPCCASLLRHWGARRPNSTPRSPRMPPSACSRTACGARSNRRAPRWSVSPRSVCARRKAELGPQANSSGTQLGARFSMKASIPSRGSGDSARAQNMVW